MKRSEKVARGTSVPQFHSWFVRYQAKDEKEMLLYPLRRDISLGYDFYFNNDPKSDHRNIKSRQNYKATEMSTVLENIHNEKDANLCCIEDAKIGNGPYELARLVTLSKTSTLGGQPFLHIGSIALCTAKYH